MTQSVSLSTSHGPGKLCFALKLRLKNVLSSAKVSLQVSRLEKKLDTCFENKEYYEAHQICRTLFYRLTASGKFDELLVLLEKGCLTLIQGNYHHPPPLSQYHFSVEQFGSAYDLSEAFAETLLKSGVPVTEQRLIAIAKVSHAMPPIEKYLSFEFFFIHILFFILIVFDKQSCSDSEGTSFSIGREHRGRKGQTSQVHRRLRQMVRSLLLLTN